MFEKMLAKDKAKARAKAEVGVEIEAEEARKLEIFDALALIFTDGQINPQKLYKKAYLGNSASRAWEEYTFSYSYSFDYIERGHRLLDYNDDATDWGVVILKITLNRDVLFEASREYKRGKWQEKEIVHCFYNGEWVDRILAYSKEIYTRYEKQQQRKADQKKVKNLQLL